MWTATVTISHKILSWFSLVPLENSGLLSQIRPLQISLKNFVLINIPTYKLTKCYSTCGSPTPGDLRYLFQGGEISPLRTDWTMFSHMYYCFSVVCFTRGVEQNVNSFTMITDFILWLCLTYFPSLWRLKFHLSNCGDTAVFWKQKRVILLATVVELLIWGTNNVANKFEINK